MKKLLIILVILLIGIGMVFSIHQKIKKEKLVEKPTKEEMIVPARDKEKETVKQPLKIMTIEEIKAMGFGIARGEGLGGPDVQLKEPIFESPSLITGAISGVEFVIVLNNTYSTLNVIKEEKIETLISTCNNCLTPYTISPNQAVIGFKKIEEGDDGQFTDQFPAIYDLITNRLISLHKSVPLSGGVSFSNDGNTAFTIEDELVIKAGIEGPEIKRINLGTYSNIAPISPDGRFAAYNDNNDQLWLINLETKEKFSFTDKKYGYFWPIWAPDSQKIAYRSLGGNLRVYDLINNTTYNFSDLAIGSFPSWSLDSKYLLFALHKVEELKEFHNSDLFIATFDGTQIIQLTDTKNIFEMEPSFSSDGKKIVFKTFDEIYAGEFENMKLKNIVKLFSKK